MAERELPQNISAEQSVLGAMMLSKDAILTATEILRDEDFYREAHRVFFRTILKMADEDCAIDLVTVTERLRKDGWLEKVGGITFVSYIANCVPTAANIVYHAKIVKEMALLRRLIETGTEMICSSYDRRDEVEDILDKAQAQIFAIASAQDTKTFFSMKELLLNAFQRVEKLHENKGGLTGLSTGFRDLDRLTYGLTPSDFIIIAARPSMGKTAFALNMLDKLAQNPSLYSRRISEKISSLMASYAKKAFDCQLATKKIFCRPDFRLPQEISPLRYAKIIAGPLYEAEEDKINDFEHRAVMGLASLPNIRWWHRNMERKGFFINGFLNHYPDFLAMTQSGVLLAIETKGDDRDNSDSRRKLELGKAWEGAAGGKYGYFMVFDKKPMEGAYAFEDFMDMVRDV